MRTTFIKVTFLAVLIVASVALVATPARADGGNPFTPTDNRVNPLTGDRIAVYTNPSSIDVLGLDTDNNGFFLTTFTMAEITGKTPVVHRTANGTVTLTMDHPPFAHIGNLNFDETNPTVIIDQGALFHITWTGGTDGADGSLPFIKTFFANYGIAPMITATAVP